MDSGRGSSSPCPWPGNVQHLNTHVLIPPTSALIKYFAALTYRIYRRRGFCLFPHGGVFHRPKVRPLLERQIGSFTRNICSCNVHTCGTICNNGMLTCVGHGMFKTGPSSNCDRPVDVWSYKREMKLCFKTSLAAHLSHFKCRQEEIIVRKKRQIGNWKWHSIGVPMDCTTPLSVHRSRIIRAVAVRSFLSASLN